jgi:hypothetical protein
MVIWAMLFLLLFGLVESSAPFLPFQNFAAGEAPSERVQRRADFGTTRVFSMDVSTWQGEKHRAM